MSASMARVDASARDSCIVPNRGRDGGAPPIVHEVLRTSGEPLDVSTRALMNSRFGQDFGRVRVHADRRAAQSASAVGARAYAAGNHVVFAEGQFAPRTSRGQELLAHELVHVVQPGGAQPTAALRLGAAAHHSERQAAAAATAFTEGRAVAVAPTPGMGTWVARDLATPLPRSRPQAKPPLTDAEIAAALQFNGARYDETNTRRIQDLVGARATGAWDASTIRLIAVLQEQFGLTKDGKVDHETFAFLQNEQRLEGSPTTAERCLTAFEVAVDPMTQAISGRTLRLGGHHKVFAEFSERCGCARYQYRQFIQGTAVGTRGTATQNLASLFPQVPGGQLPVAFQEDGNTNWASPNYGHRDQAGRDTTDALNAENHYVDGQGTTDQTKGCRYHGEDFPKLTVNNLQSGDVVTVVVQFRGEIQRDNTPVQTRLWTDINANVTMP